MKILLISPVKDVNFRTNKGLMMPQLALFILQGLTPEKHQVKIIEEEAVPVNLDEECDLVGISCMTSNAVRAYEIATEFKKRNKTVVMGGVHPTILPDEALQYSDSVVIGEAEGVWEQLLLDFENGNLQQRYHNPSPDLSKYVPKQFAALKSKRLFNIIPIMTTRGCPYNCEFCCVTDLFGKKIRHIPVENIVRDIKESKAKNFMFLDDNIIGHTKYATELFTAIKPLKIKWVGQASISFAKDTAMMQLAADSGCRGLFIGLESVSETQLKEFRKSVKDLAELRSSIKKIRKMGILINASMIFGFDNDTADIFDTTYEFLKKNKISTVSFNVLTPYPGTETFRKMESSGRLINKNWKYYDHNTVVYKPINMTPYELQSGKTHTRKKFYSFSSIMYRLMGNLFSPHIFLAMNYANYKQTKVELKRLETLKSQLTDFTSVTQQQELVAEEV